MEPQMGDRFPRQDGHERPRTRLIKEKDGGGWWVGPWSEDGWWSDGRLDGGTIEGEDNIGL